MGWCNTNSAIIRHANVDIWLMAEQTPTFDYGSPIPVSRVHHARSVEGVSWSEGMIMTWSFWQRSDGRRVNVEVVGLDGESVGGPWEMKESCVNAVHEPDSVIVDELFLSTLGVRQVGDEVELFGRRAVVRGISRNVRTFTASPFVFTSIHTARKYDSRYRPDEVTYALIRCKPGYEPADVAAALRREVDHVEVLTTNEFENRTVKYWMLGTGVGITVVLTAGLGLLVSLVVTSQTLFTITQENLPHYVTLVALGFSRTKLTSWVVTQSVFLGGIGAALGGVGFAVASNVSMATPVPLETTPLIFASLVAVSLFCSVLSSMLSVRAIFRIDPVSVFRG